MAAASNTGKRKAKDRDGVYKHRGYWHVGYRDAQTGQWRCKTTGTTAFNHAKKVKRRFLELLEGQYNPTNDRTRFSDAVSVYTEDRRVSASAPGPSAWKRNGCER